jgi:hypothetical protein
VILLRRRHHGGKRGIVVPLHQPSKRGE